MDDPERSAPGCFAACPHLTSGQGACGHEFRDLLVRYLREHPDAPCPIFEELRAEKMAELARRLEQGDPG